MPRVDLGAFLDEKLVLPYAGKDYQIPSPDAKTGLHLQSLFNLTRKIGSGGQASEQDIRSLDLDDAEERNLYQQILGGAYEEMVADGIPFTALKAMALYAWGHFSESAETGRRLMEFSLSGGVQAPTRKERRAAASKSSRGSSGSGPSTRTPDSTSPTSSSTTVEPVSA